LIGLDHRGEVLVEPFATGDPAAGSVAERLFGGLDLTQ
jgi:hypothetical protein